MMKRQSQWRKKIPQSNHLLELDTESHMEQDMGFQLFITLTAELTVDQHTPSITQSTLMIQLPMFTTLKKFQFTTTFTTQPKTLSTKSTQSTLMKMYTM